MSVQTDMKGKLIITSVLEKDVLEILNISTSETWCQIHFIPSESNCLKESQKPQYLILEKNSITAKSFYINTLKGFVLIFPSNLLSGDFMKKVLPFTYRQQMHFTMDVCDEREFLDYYEQILEEVDSKYIHRGELIVCLLCIICHMAVQKHILPQYFKVSSN